MLSGGLFPWRNSNTLFYFVPSAFVLSRFRFFLPKRFFCPAPFGSTHTIPRDPPGDPPVTVKGREVSKRGCLREEGGFRNPRDPPCKFPKDLLQNERSTKSRLRGQQQNACGHVNETISVRRTYTWVRPNVFGVNTARTRDFLKSQQARSFNCLVRRAPTQMLPRHVTWKNIRRSAGKRSDERIESRAMSPHCVLTIGEM